MPSHIVVDGFAFGVVLLLSKPLLRSHNTQISGPADFGIMKVKENPDREAGDDPQPERSLYKGTKFMIATNRKPNSTTRGGGFDAATIRAVWNKAQIVSGTDANVRRKDGCGAWIDWTAYGQTTENGYGWEIDHFKPVAKGGTDDLSNLQPLQWQNNRGKGDTWPQQWACAVVAKN